MTYAYSIEQYNYKEEYSVEDEFIKVAEQMLTHDLIVFATPVYWYSMSGYMKIFFDRLTDLTDSHKPIGKQLKGKRVALITVSTDDELPEGFEIPFKRTAEYFDMGWVGCFFTSSKQLQNPLLLKQQVKAWVKEIGL